MKKVFLIIYFFVFLIVPTNLFSREDEDYVLIGIAGFPDPIGLRTLEDVKMDMQNWINNLIQIGGLKPSDNKALVFKGIRRSAFPWGKYFLAKAAVDVIDQVTYYKEHGKKVHILAHSQGTHVLTSAALLVDYIRYHRGDIKLGLRAKLEGNLLWNALDKDTQERFQFTVNRFDIESRVGLFDLVITAGTPVDPEYPGWLSLGRNSEAVQNYIGRLDPICYISFIRSVLDGPTGVGGLINWYFPFYSNIMTIYVNTFHNYEKHPAVVNSMIGFFKRGQNTPEEARDLIVHTHPDLTAGQIDSLWDEWKRTGLFPPPPPPPPPPPKVRRLFSCMDMAAIETELNWDEFSLEFLNKTLENISITLSGTNTQSSLQLEMSNQGEASVNLMLLSGVVTQPELNTIQGMCTVGPLSAGTNLQKNNLHELSSKSEMNELITVFPGEIVTLPLEAACLNFNIVGAPDVGYADFDIRGISQPEIFYLNYARKVIELWGEQEDMPLFANKPTIWYVTSFLEEVQLLMLQFAIWGHTDNANYLDLRQIIEEQGDSVNVSTQVFADLVNLIIQTSGIEYTDDLFIPEWDVDWSASVDSIDLEMVSSQFDQTILIDFPNPDANRDGLVDIFDLVKVGVNYGRTYSSSRSETNNTLSSINHIPRLTAAIPNKQISSIMQQHNTRKNSVNASLRHDLKSKSYSLYSPSNFTSVRIRLIRKDKEFYTAEVKVDGGTDLSGYQFDFKYNPLQFELVDTREGTLLASDSTITYIRSPEIRSGLLKNVAGIRLAANGMSRAGVLHRFIFKKVSTETGELENAVQLENVKFSDSRAMPISHTLLPTQIQEGTVAKVSIPELQGKRGRSITIPINISDTENVLSGTISFSYNDDILVNPEVKVGNILSGFSFVSNTTVMDQITFTFAGATPLKGDGTVAEVTFDVTGSVGESTELNLTSIALNDGAVAADLVHGKFTVISSIQVSLPEAQAEAGSTIMLPINIEGTEEIFAGTVSFMYNPSVLLNLVVNAGNLLNGFTFQENTDVSGEVTFAFAGANSFSIDGTLAEITFDVVGSPGDSTFLDMMSAVFNDTIQASLQDGKILLVESNAVKVTYEFPLENGGWYMISLPIIPEDSIVSSLFPTSLAAYSWDFENQNYTPVTKLTPGCGYWLVFPTALTVEIWGQPVNSYTQNYTNQKGWDIVGSVFEPSPLVDDIDGSVIGTYGWDPINQQYITIPDGQTLQPKQSYWILVYNIPCSITIGSPESNYSGFSKIINWTELETFHAEFGKEPPSPPLFLIKGDRLVKIPQDYSLSQNFPNPFNTETTIEYTLPKSGRVLLGIYNILGDEVRRLVDEKQEAGIYRVRWNGKDNNAELVPSGIYIGRITAEEFVGIKKLLFIK